VDGVRPSSSSHTGLPHGQFGFGGEHFGKAFELGEDDELRVLVNHDRDLMRAVADGHAVPGGPSMTSTPPAPLHRRRHQRVDHLQLARPAPNRRSRKASDPTSLFDAAHYLQRSQGPGSSGHWGATVAG